MEHIVGVIGGMGPQATAEFLRRLTAFTPAGRDQDHLRVIVYSNPKIPDRTAALMGVGADPLPELAASVRLLQRAGATLLAMPCNTAHHWLPRLQHETTLPIVDMVLETVYAVHHEQPQVRRVGLLATAGTIVSGLYERELAAVSLALLTPDRDQQEMVNAAIAGVKAGDLSGRSTVLGVAQALLRRGADAIVFGCTEIPLLVSASDVGCLAFDALSILAEQVVLRARG